MAQSKVRGFTQLENGVDFPVRFLLTLANGRVDFPSGWTGNISTIRIAPQKGEGHHNSQSRTSQLWDVGSHPETFTSWHLEMAFLRHFQGISMARVALAHIAKDTSVPSLPWFRSWRSMEPFWRPRCLGPSPTDQECHGVSGHGYPAW